MIIFQSLRPLLKQASFLEANGAIVEIGWIGKKIFYMHHCEIFNC